MPYVPAAFGFHPGTPFFQPATVIPHPYLAGHPAAGQSFPGQPLFFASTSNENGQSAAYYPGHSQGNIAFPFLLTSSLTTATPSTTSDNSDSSLFNYSTTTTATATGTSVMDSNTYPA